MGKLEFFFVSVKPKTETLSCAEKAGDKGDVLSDVADVDGTYG